MASGPPKANVQTSSSYSSREFNVLVSIMNEVKNDVRAVITQVGDLRADVSSLAGDMKTTNKEVEYLRDELRRLGRECGHLRSVQDSCAARRNYETDTSKIMKLEDSQHRSVSSAGSDSGSTLVTVAKYIGIILAGFVMGVGSLAAAWVQLSAPKSGESAQTYIPASSPQYTPRQSHQKDVDTERQQKKKP